MMLASLHKFVFKLVSYGKSVTNMNDGTSLKRVKQIRQTDNNNNNVIICLSYKGYFYECE